MASRFQRSVSLSVLFFCGLTVAFTSSPCIAGGPMEVTPLLTAAEIQRKAKVHLRTQERVPANQFNTTAKELRNELALLTRNGISLRRGHSEASDAVASIFRKIDCPAADRFVASGGQVSSEGYRVRVGYLIPKDRVPNSVAFHRAGELVLWYQRWFADHMERNGHGKATFAYEAEP